MPQYNNANNIAETDLAGCLPVVQDINNFQVVAVNLTNRIALWYTRERAWRIYGVVTLEAADINIPPFEYVINELQFEFRVARVRGVDNLDKEKESQLLERWARHVARKKGDDAALDFITVLKNNRAKRKR